jgi:hypothetical protein
VQDRLAGLITAPDGAAVPGPEVRWIGRRHGRRTDRRWARSWSPEQIAGRLRVDFPDDGSMRISHEAIYQALYVQGRGALRRELTAWLRTGRALRCPEHGPGGAASSSSPRRSCSASGRPRSPTGRCLGTGKVTSSLGWAARRSGPWSSAPRGSRCCCVCPPCPATATRPGSTTVPRWPGRGPRPSGMPSPPRS